MSRINFGARHDYESLANFKVLQNVFIKNRIDKPIPVDRLVRCKMQDNLEFLQWIKKFWDMHYTGEDPARRMSVAPRGATRAPAVSNEMLNQLTAEIDEMKVSVDSLERERDFYFGKLRDVEVIVQERLAEILRPTEDGEELVDPNYASESDLLKQIQSVLYHTEEGFELPDAAETEDPAPLDETEIF
ncbi:microtubule integrity protein mal3 [Malassezia caprae]|uniref:Microtubule integrity protein mal3 n=1 Tax=Malassezia caprae TaxID=1381934 RepID=A0AAF0E8E5_9BASI|nr:microtubule integrity protein mal3 [Malassezia caprae]